MPTIDLGSVVGPQGAQGNTGPAGPQGVAGPSLVSASTQTTLTGVLAGDGNTVGVRAVDATPTNNSTNLVSSGGVYNKITNDVAASYQRTCNPNLLDNWYFVGGGTGNGVFPVNQRGATTGTTADGVYGIDRWKWSYSGTIGSWSLPSTGLTLTPASSASANMSQVVEFDSGLSGKKVTASILLSNGEFHSGTITRTSGTNQYFLEEDNIQLRFVSNLFRVACISGRAITIVAVKLELGNQQTLCHNEGTTENPVWVLNEIPNFAIEMYKCAHSTADNSDPYANLRSAGIFRLVTAAEVSKSGGTATISYPHGYTAFTIRITGAYLLASGTMYMGSSVEVSHLDGSGIHVVNNGGANGYIYVDYC